MKKVSKKTFKIIITLFMFLVILGMNNISNAAPKKTTKDESHDLNNIDKYYGEDVGDLTYSDDKPEVIGREKQSFLDFWKIGWGFIDYGETQGESQISTSTITSQVIPIIQFITAIGFIVLIIAILVIGIRTMLATTTEKAGLKKKLVGLVIATIIIASSYTIWLTVYNIMVNISSQAQ